MADIEAYLSYDDVSLLALCAACRQEKKGAWNLLLLAMGRRLRSYLQTQELDALLQWLVEAIRKGQHPGSYLRYSIKDAIKSHNASAAREEEYVQGSLDEGVVQLAHDGEARTLASWVVSGDPILGKRLAAALGELTKTQRAAFLLSELEEMSTKEIAERLGISEGGVRVRLTEARKILRNIFGNGSPSH